MGDWNVVKSRNAFEGQTHESGTINDSATISIDGAAFTLVYTSSSANGALDVLVDGEKIATVDQGSTRTKYQKKWASPDLGSGNHLLQFVHVSGDTVDIDMIAGSGSNNRPSRATVTPKTRREFCPFNEPNLPDDLRRRNIYRYRQPSPDSKSHSYPLRGSTAARGPPIYSNFHCESHADESGRQQYSNPDLPDDLRRRNTYRHR